VRPKGASYLILPDRFTAPGTYSPAGEMTVALGEPMLRVGCGLFEWLKRDYDDVERRWVYRMRDQAAFVLAHEIGHHVGGHLQAMADERDRLRKEKASDPERTLDRKQLSLEREADVFAVELACGGGFDPAAGFGAMMNAIPFYARFGLSAADSHGSFDARARFIRAAADCCGEKGLDRGCLGSRAP
jgi:hypothetical protein